MHCVLLPGSLTFGGFSNDKWGRRWVGIFGAKCFYICKNILPKFIPRLRANSTLSTIKSPNAILLAVKGQLISKGL